MNMFPPDNNAIIGRSDAELLAPALEVIAQLRRDVADLSRTVAQLQEANTREVMRRRRAEAILRSIPRHPFDCAECRGVCEKLAEIKQFLDKPTSEDE